MAAQELTDKIPPHDDDAEKAALGSMLLDKDAVTESIARLTPDDFYSFANGKIFKAIRAINDKNDTRVDILSVCDELRRTGQLDSAGGEAYVASLTNVVPTPANIKFYVELVQKAAMRRALITIASKITAKSFDVSLEPEQILEKAQQFIFELIEKKQRYKYRIFEDVIRDTLPLMDALCDKEYTGIRSGFKAIDQITRGFQNSEMIVIGARPSIGKTALALNMAANIAFQQGISTAFFSLEMRDTQLAMRILSSESQIDFKSLRTQIESEKSKNYNKIITTADRIFKKKLFIEDVPNMQLMDLRTQARHICAKEKVEIIFIDYIGLIGVEDARMPRFEQVSEISRSIKGLARELGIPVVVLSQVGRGSEGAPPTLANLRDSGAVEQDADVVMLLHRERKLDPEKADLDYFETDVDIAKNRNGPTGLVKLAYRPKFTRFDSTGTDDYH